MLGVILGHAIMHPLCIKNYLFALLFSKGGLRLGQFIVRRILEEQLQRHEMGFPQMEIIESTLDQCLKDVIGMFHVDLV